jgi:hypothetical protein
MELFQTGNYLVDYSYQTYKFLKSHLFPTTDYTDYNVAVSRTFLTLMTIYLSQVLKKG